MKRKSGIGMVLILVLIAGITAMITYTFSRYTSTATGTDTAQVAPWVVKVNGDDITTSNTFTAEDISWYNNESYITSGYAAPGRLGQFTIEIDPSGSQVAMQYEINLADEVFEQYPQLVLQRVMNQSTGQMLTQNTDGAYTGIISLADVQANKATTIVINFQWNSATDNTLDTEIGTTIEELEFPITITVSQLLT